MEARRRVNGRFVSREFVDEAAAERGKDQASTKTLRPKQCRGFAQKRMAEAFPEIVDCFVRKAKQGSIPHAKALANLGGLDEVHVGEAAKSSKARVRRRRSLTEKLMEELKRGRAEAGRGTSAMDGSKPEAATGK